MEEEDRNTPTPTLTPTLPRESIPPLTDVPVVLLDPQVSVQSTRFTEAQIQLSIQRLGRCSDDRPWRKVAGGYECEGGGHFIPNV